LQVIKDLGATCTESENTLQISGGLNPKTNQINCGESGLSFRMFTPVAALHAGKLNILGGGSLAKRPMNFMEVPLQSAGAEICSTNGYLPLTVKGTLVGGEIFTDGSMSSQFLTGLLMALPLAKQASTVYVENLKSKPYIDLTLEILNLAGIEIENSNYEKFYIEGNQTYKPVEYTVEGDWSNAAFLLVAGAIGGRISVSGLTLNSTQGDKKIMEAVRDSGAEITVSESEIQIKKNELRAFNFDATETPDLFPPLVALAANCNGVSQITGVSRLAHKESNRAEALKTEFGKIGITIWLENDTMFIEGGKITGGTMHSHNDHRIAMAAALAAVNSAKPITIEGADAVNKSYPNFFDHFAQIANLH